MKKKVILIISITSDIGKELAKMYLNKGNIVIGTYRNKIKGLRKDYLFECDISKKNSIKEFIKQLKATKLKWDTLIFCPCNPLPLTPFFESNFNEWNESVNVNLINQLRILHELYNFRNKNNICNLIYFAGGGINKAGENFSAYTISKLMLIKMCEILNEETKDLNPFVIGTGWVKTKVHKKILKNLNKDDKRYKQIKEFLKNGTGTKIKDIFELIELLCKKGKENIGGRNFSVVYDKWKSNKLFNDLTLDNDLYKLRRNERLKTK